MRTLCLVVRDPRGRIGYQEIGHAIMAADTHGNVTSSALRNSLLALASYEAHSPIQAAAAMRTLAELGDVDFEERDFAPQWLQPDECISIIDGLLGRRRRALAEATRGTPSDAPSARRGQDSGLQLLVELEPHERLPIKRIRFAK